MNDARADLAFTGERFVPGTPGEIWYEHWHRYHFAAPLTQGARVLDVACGTGYGSALLARRAREVVGVDLSPDAITHAQQAYAAVSNVQFRQGDCTALPFGDGTFDVVVSFETIEHIEPQERFLDEVRRVLAPNGLLVLSCPNRPEYSEARGITNPFHVRELDRRELAAMLAPIFATSAWYGQHLSFFSVIAAETPARDGEIFELSEASPTQPSAGHARPRYFVVLATDDVESLARVPPRLSVLADRDEWVYRDYENVTASVTAAHVRGNALEAQVASLCAAHDEAVRQRDHLLAEHALAVEQRDAASRDVVQLHQQLEASLAWQRKLENDIRALNAELARREGWSWWRKSLLRLLGRSFSRSSR